MRERDPTRLTTWGRQFHDGELNRIANIDRTRDLGWRRHEPNQAVDQIIDVAPCRARPISPPGPPLSKRRQAADGAARDLLRRALSAELTFN
jgi:hypothetical protein